SMIAVLMGGRVSEELTFDRMTTGAGNDIEKVTELARKMVCEWGMSDAMGPLTFGKKEEQIFLGREVAQPRDYSGAPAPRPARGRPTAGAEVTESAEPTRRPGVLPAPGSQPA